MASFPKLYKLGWENLNQAGQQAIKLAILLLVIFIWYLCTIRLDISKDRDEEDVDSPSEEEADDDPSGQNRADEQSDDG